MVKESFFFTLVRLGIGKEKLNSCRYYFPNNTPDWNAMKNLAEQQGLSTIVLDGIERFPEQLRPPKQFLLEWIGEAQQGYEYRYDQYRKAIAELGRRRDFVNVHTRRSSAEMEKVFKEMAKDDTHYVEVKGERVCLPAPNLHALFLIKHAVSHFVGTNINLRQVLDWAFFAEKHTKEIDWKWLNEMMEKYGIKDFYCCLNAICVEDLGFDAGIFHGVQFNPTLKDRIFMDILSPEFGTEEPKYLIPRLLYKYKRWKGNSWKRELCYNESDWSTFWSGIWAHILKLASI